MHKRFLLLTFFLFFANALLWVFIVPIWHFPDEQSHFGQVAFIAIKGRNPYHKEPLDLTDEIFKSEVFLGTDRDIYGNNKFTFHPEFKIEYTDSLIGKYESDIIALANTSPQFTFVKKEASLYPILYYLPAAIIYRLFITADLFIRISMIRIWSVFLFMLTLFVTYKLGRLLFPKPDISAIILSILVGFQPMMIFANAGVNSDSLGNLIFCVYLYLSGLVIIKGASINRIWMLIIILALSVYSKTQFSILIPLFVLLTLFLIWRDYHGIGRKIIFFLIITLPAFGFYLGYRLRVDTFSLYYQFFSWLNLSSLIKFSMEYTLSHTYREVLPWYWGIYDWLGVTYPRIVHRTINWIILLAGFGFIKFAILVVRHKKYFSRKFQAGIYLIIVSSSYFVAISLYDWYSWYTGGYQLGVQGRYFFPVISVNMIILLAGWGAIFPGKWKFRIMGIKLLGLFMIILNIYALYTVSKTYYDLSTFNLFILQASQYKPWFVKGLGLVSIIVTFFITLTVFLIEYKNYPHEKEV